MRRAEQPRISVRWMSRAAHHVNSQDLLVRRNLMLICYNRHTGRCFDCLHHVRLLFLYYHNVYITALAVQLGKLPIFGNPCCFFPRQRSELDLFEA